MSATLNEKVDFRVSGGVISATSSAFGFGPLTEISSTQFYSEAYGYLNFPGDGSDKSWAWSESLKGWLSTDGRKVYSVDYGYLTPGDVAGWVKSSKLGWIRIHSHGSAVPPSDSPWVWSNSYGWVISNRAGTGQFFWCERIKSWLSAGSNGTLWSYNYGWLTAGSNAGWVNSSALGWIYIGDFSGWVWSARLGWVISNGDGSATYFWHSSYGWLASNGTGWVWSYNYGRWM